MTSGVELHRLSKSFGAFSRSMASARSRYRGRSRPRAVAKLDAPQATVLLALLSEREHRVLELMVDGHRRVLAVLAHLREAYECS